MFLNRLRDAAERGAVLPLVVLLLFVLLGFAAFAVDLGAAWAVRRGAQTTADAAVLAGALEYLRPNPPTQQETVELVRDYTNRNARTPVDLDRWLACTDADRPADFAPLAYDATGDGTDDTFDCISLKNVSNEPTLLRVRLPDIPVPTSFARLFGLDSIPVTAVAVAEIRYNLTQDVLPFSLPANVAHGTEECLGTPPTGLLPDDTVPCTGPAQGNFGMIDSPWFGAGDPHDTTGQECPSDPNFSVRTRHNLALGLDHLITIWPDPLTLPADGTWLGNNHAGADSCDTAFTDTTPYVLLTQPGNTQTGLAILHDGLFGDHPSGTSATDPGRLRQTAPPAHPERLTLRTTTTQYTVDNVGLWQYLDFSKIAGGGQCSQSAFQGKAGRALTDQLLTCLDPANPKMFDKDLIDSPRFAVVPVLNYRRGDQYGNKWWAVKEYKPVYLQSTWFSCGGSDLCVFHPDDMPGGSVIFNPGEGTASPTTPSGGTPPANGAHGFQVQGVSALVLDWDWFPPEVRNQIGVPVPFEVYLYR